MNTALPIKKNTISAQSIEEGKKVSGGTEILLTISDGPEQMKVPDVVKKGLEEAKVLLEQQKLKHTVTFEYNDEYGKGIVLEQSVKAGKKVDEGSTIDLVVSKGERKNRKRQRKDHRKVREAARRRNLVVVQNRNHLKSIALLANQ